MQPLEGYGQGWPEGSWSEATWPASSSSSVCSTRRRTMVSTSAGAAARNLCHRVREAAPGGPEMKIVQDQTQSCIGKDFPYGENSPSGEISVTRGGVRGAGRLRANSAWSCSKASV